MISIELNSPSVLIHHLFLSCRLLRDWTGDSVPTAKGSETWRPHETPGVSLRVRILMADLLINEKMKKRMTVLHQHPLRSPPPQDAANSMTRKTRMMY